MLKKEIDLFNFSLNHCCLNEKSVKRLEDEDFILPDYGEIPPPPSPVNCTIAKSDIMESGTQKDDCTYDVYFCFVII